MLLSFLFKSFPFKYFGNAKSPSRYNTAVAGPLHTAREVNKKRSLPIACCGVAAKAPHRSRSEKTI
jgi:hypothetical protein